MVAVRKKKVTKLHSNYIDQQAEKQKKFDIKRRKLVRRLIGIGICAVIFSVTIISTLITQSANIEMREKQQDVLKNELAELKKTEVELNAEIEKLKDDEYIAKIARNEFFLSEEGEVIFKVAE